MKPTALASLLPLLLLAAVAAQDEPLMPVAKEVEKLSVLLGDWTGEGTMSEPSGDVTKWTARRSARWSHGGHFVEEDYAFTFDGMAQPYVWRTYVGWDRERSRYCAAIVGSDGAARLEDLQWLPDGTLLQFATRRQGGMTYVERTRLTFGGDTIGYASEILMPMGPSLALVDGTFRRGGEAFGGAFETAGWMGAKPHESLVRLARMSGTYETEGAMVMEPDQPPTKITGTDTFQTVYGGMAIMGRTDGAAEGAPGKYVSTAFWAHDAARDAITCVYVDNMGTIGTMDLRFVGAALVSTSAATMGGQPVAQRFVVEFAEDGSCTHSVGHTMLGTMPPFESFRSSCRRKK
jgi:hypothetical protein